MGKRNRNHNVAVARRAANELGATVLSVRGSGKHHNMQVETSDGIKLWLRLSKSTTDPYKQRGWVRQAIVNAAVRQQRR